MKKLIIIISIFTVACKSHVYVSGVSYREGKPLSKYWKDGVSFDLYYDNTLGLQTGANSIFVVDTNIYVAGFIEEPTNRAVYWKNGQEIKLVEGDIRHYSSANQVIVIKDKDIFIVGQYSENNSSLTQKIVYWKNGQMYNITDVASKTNPVAKSIAVNGNDIYVAGYSNGLTSTYDAKYWKNGKEYTLTKGNSSSLAHSVFVFKNDVYIAGSEDNGAKFIAKYWKNGEEHLLANGTEVNSIVVDNGNVYVAGYERASDGSSHIAKYWKNGKEIILPSESKSAIANCIFVKKNDVYVAGYDGSQAVYWKNGKKIILKDGIIATSIFVK